MRRRPISGNKYPPTNFAKFGFRATPEWACKAVLVALLEVKDGAKAEPEATKREATEKQENFILLVEYECGGFVEMVMSDDGIINNNIYYGLEMTYAK